jgi:hypothetical protein
MGLSHDFSFLQVPRACMTLVAADPMLNSTSAIKAIIDVANAFQ